MNNPIVLQAAGRRGLLNGFFPFLNTLHIHLANHTAIEFLRNLHPDFCLNITELHLITKMVDEAEEAEYNYEMIQILRKFKRLIDSD